MQPGNQDHSERPRFERKHCLGANCCLNCFVACRGGSFVGRVGTYRLRVCQASSENLSHRELLLLEMKKESGRQHRNWLVGSSECHWRLTRLRRSQQEPLLNAQALPSVTMGQSWHTEIIVRHQAVHQNY